ncbi:MAG: hypothetical protein MUO21_12000, partial [Nitrososphaeraceae archaeon]|nr:hypothetical protein [Nitrososphaeraceae archaeon]
MNNSNDVSMKKNKEDVFNKIAILLSLIMVVYTIYTKMTFPPGPFYDRSIYLVLSSLALFCFQFPKSRGIRKILVAVGAIFAVSGCLYIVISVEKIVANWYMADTMDFYFFVIY